MSNHTNPRKNENHRTENGPRWEDGNPGKGCNSTHVAKARAWWKRYKNRAERHTGGPARNFNYVDRGRPPCGE